MPEKLEDAVVKLGPEIASVRIYKLSHGYYLELEWAERAPGIVDGTVAHVVHHERAAASTTEQAWRLIERWTSKAILGDEPEPHDLSEDLLP